MSDQAGASGKDTSRTSVRSKLTSVADTYIRHVAVADSDHRVGLEFLAALDAVGDHSAAAYFARAWSLLQRPDGANWRVLRWVQEQHETGTTISDITDYEYVKIFAQTTADPGVCGDDLAMSWLCDKALDLVKRGSRFGDPLLRFMSELLADCDPPSGTQADKLSIPRKRIAAALSTRPPANATNINVWHLLTATTNVSSSHKAAESRIQAGSLAAALQLLEGAFELHIRYFGIADGDGFPMVLDLMSLLANTGAWDRLADLARRCAAALPATDVRTVLITGHALVLRAVAAPQKIAEEEVRTHLAALQTHLQDFDPEDAAAILAQLSSTIADRNAQLAGDLTQRAVEFLGVVSRADGHADPAQVDADRCGVLLFLGLAAIGTRDLVNAVERLEEALRLVEAGVPLSRKMQLRLYGSLAHAYAALSISRTHIFSRTHFLKAGVAGARLPRARALMDKALAIYASLPDQERADMARPLAPAVATVTNAIGDLAYRRRIASEFFPASTESAYSEQARLEILAAEALSAAGHEVYAARERIKPLLQRLEAIYGRDSRTMKKLQMLVDRPRWSAWSSGIARRRISLLRRDVASAGISREVAEAAGDGSERLWPGLVQTSSRPRVEFVARRSEVLWEAAWPALEVLLGLLALASILEYLFFGLIPVDYRVLVLALAGAVPCFLIGLGLFSLAAFVGKRFGNPPVAFGPEGIELDGFMPIPWENLHGIDARWHGMCQRIRLSLSDGSTKWLEYPRSYRWWRADPWFDAHLATLRQWARDYSASVDHASPHRPSRTFREAAFLLGAAVCVAIQAATSGLVMPWSPTVLSLPDVCGLSATTHIDQYFSGLSVVDTGMSAPQQRVSNRVLERRSCEWVLRSSDQSGLAGVLDITVDRFADFILFSPTTSAAAALHVIVRYGEFIDVAKIDDVGDEAYVATEQTQGKPSRLHVGVRRSNVIVDVALAMTAGLPEPSEREAIAARIALRIAEHITDLSTRDVG